jgi:hypothetical protein
VDFQEGTEASISLLMMPSKYAVNDSRASTSNVAVGLRLPPHNQLGPMLRQHTQKNTGLQEANRRFKKKGAKSRQSLTFNPQSKRHGLVDKLREQFR